MDVRYIEPISGPSWKQYLVCVRPGCVHHACQQRYAAFAATELSVSGVSTPIAQADFLVERLGGPKLYSQRKGKHHRLIHRHSPYDLNPKSAARWLEV